MRGVARSRWRQAFIRCLGQRGARIVPKVVWKLKGGFGIKDLTGPAGPGGWRLAVAL